MFWREADASGLSISSSYALQFRAKAACIWGAAFKPAASAHNGSEPVFSPA